MKRCYGMFAVVMAILCAALAARAADLQPGRMVGPDDAAVATLKGKLDKMIPVQFLDTPLKRVVELLQRESEVPFVTTTTGQTDTVALEAKSMSIRDVLDRSCLATGTDWDVDKGVIVIGSRRDIAKRHLETRVYDVRALLVNLPSFFGPALDADMALDNTLRGGSGSRMGGQGAADSGGGGGGVFGLSGGGGGREGLTEEKGPTRAELVAQLARMIEDTVGDRADWTENGGDISSLKELNGLLIVRTPTRNHAQIRQLLDQIDEAARHMVGVEARFLIVQTGVADSMLALGKGGLILNAKDADAFLDKVLKPESGSASLGVTRTVCHNGQRVYTAAEHPTIFLSGTYPIADAAGVNPTLSTVRTGVVLDFCPTQSMDGKSITLVFRSDIAPQVQLRQTELPVAGSAAEATSTSNGAIEGRVKMNEAPPPSTQPGRGARTEPLEGTISGRITGSITPPKPAATVSGTVTLEMPEQDLVRFRSAVRVPDNGAVVFAASSRVLKTTTAPNSEVLLFIRVKSVN
jgi:hypothetical protein